MAMRKRIVEARRARLVREARAGLIPASDDLVDEVRARTDHAARMVRTAKSHLGSVKRVSEEHAITSILADLRHYCDFKSLQFDELDAAADALYFEDKRHEARWIAPIVETHRVASTCQNTK